MKLKSLPIDPLLAPILLAGFALRIAYASAPHVCFGDESCYLWLARSLFETGSYAYYDGQPELHFPPLFPIALGVLNVLVGDWERVSLVAYVLFSGLLPLPIYVLARDMYSRSTARIAAAIAAIIPVYSVTVLHDTTLSGPLFLLCLLTGIAFVHRAGMEPKARWHLAAGTALGLAYLARPEGIVFVAAGGFYLVAVRLFDGRLHRARTILPIGGYAAGFLVVALPYVVWLHGHTGQWSFSTKGSTTYRVTRSLVWHDGVGFQKECWGLNEAGEIQYYAHDFRRGTLGMMFGQYRTTVFRDVKKNLTNTESLLTKPWVFGWILFPIAALGALGETWSRARQRSEALNLLVLVSFAPFLIFFMDARFLYASVLPLVLWLALGLEHVFRWVRGTPWPGPFGSPIVTTAACIAIVLALCAHFLDSGRDHHIRKTAEQSEVWAATKFLRENTPPDAVVMATGPEVAFHAGRRWLPLPVAPIAKALDYGRKRGATHICIRGRYLALRPEQKAELYDAPEAPEGLRLLGKSDRGERGTFAAYEILPAAAPDTRR